MFEKFSRSWELVKASAAVLRSDKELMLFPIAVRHWPRWWCWRRSWCRCSRCASSSTASAWPARCSDFVFYFCQYSGDHLLQLRPGRRGDDPPGRRRSDPRRRHHRGQGAAAGDPRLRRDRRHRRHAAAGAARARTTTSWCACSAAASAWRGRWRPSWWCRCWSAEDIGPIDALKQSVGLLKRTWGENAIGNVGIGVAFGLITFGVDRWIGAD